MAKDFETVKKLSEAWDAQDVLAWGLSQYHGQIAVASSFGLEDVVLINMAIAIEPQASVFTLDTDFLFPETYALIERIEARYGITVECLRPEVSPAQQAEIHGPSLWQCDPDLCCRIRKLVPLERKLRTLKAWVTGIRREQSPTRAHAEKVEWDERFALVKLNPLVDWTTYQVREYISMYGIPYNPLHDQNYPSIGCTHCTRAVHPGEAPRAGRWSGFNKTECGLHTKPLPSNNRAGIASCTDESP